VSDGCGARLEIGKVDFLEVGGEAGLFLEIAREAGPSCGLWVPVARIFEAGDFYFGSWGLRWRRQVRRAEAIAKVGLAGGVDEEVHAELEGLGVGFFGAHLPGVGEIAGGVDHEQARAVAEALELDVGRAQLGVDAVDLVIVGRTAIS